MTIKVYTRKRGKGYQYIVTYKQGGKWKQRSKQGFAKNQDAKNAGQALALELSKVADTEIYTFKQVADMMALDGSKARKTLYAYKSYLNTLKPLHGLVMGDIGYQDITPILSEYRNGHKYNSVKALHRYGSSVFNYAMNKLRIVNRNPFKDYDLSPPKKSDKRESVILSKDEIVKLAKSAPPEIAAVIALQGFCGLRVSEALGLTRADIVDNVIKVSHQRRGGKYHEPLKTRNSYRTVPIAPAALPFLKALPLRFDGLLFRVTYDTVREFLGTQGIISHDLRHSYTTNLIAMGVDFKTASMLIGDSVDMVMKTYSHVSVDMMASATEKILENF